MSWGDWVGFMDFMTFNVERCFLLCLLRDHITLKKLAQNCQFFIYFSQLQTKLFYITIKYGKLTNIYFFAFKYFWLSPQVSSRIAELLVYLSKMCDKFHCFFSLLESILTHSEVSHNGQTEFIHAFFFLYTLQYGINYGKWYFI